MTNPNNFFRDGHRKLGGRKKGTPNKATKRAKELFQEAVQGNIPFTPLQVMYGVMKVKIEAEDYDGALLAAEKAAPYVHARLNATDVRVQHSVAGKSDAEIAIEIQLLREKVHRSRSQPLIEAVPESSPEPVSSAVNCTTNDVVPVQS